METEVIGAVSHVDFSLTALFLRATVTVKIVMVMLILASIWSWAVVIDRSLRYARARKNFALFEKAFWSGQMLDELYERVKDNPTTALEKVFAAGMGEWQKSHSAGVANVLTAQQRIDRAMNVVLGQQAENLNKGLSVLATVGAISPFVGLFGTVWGIKNAFEDIAIQQSTNLAVVAPGIAEALVATALGLVTAIPAVVFYNKLSGDADGLLAKYEGFTDEFAMILSRQLEKKDS